MCLPGQADHHASITVLSAQSGKPAEAFTRNEDSGPRLTFPDTAVLISQELPAGTQEPTQGKHAEKQGCSRTFTLTSSSHRLRGGITMVVLSSMT